MFLSHTMIHENTNGDFKKEILRFYNTLVLTATCFQSPQGKLFVKTEHSRGIKILLDS